MKEDITERDDENREDKNERMLEGPVRRVQVAHTLRKHLIFVKTL